MVGLYYEGLTLTEIGRRMGRTCCAVSRHLTAAGHHKPQRLSLSDKNSRQIADWYLRGVKVDNIARRFGISMPTLYRQLRKHDVPLRQPHYRP